MNSKGTDRAFVVAGSLEYFKKREDRLVSKLEDALGEIAHTESKFAEQKENLIRVRDELSSAAAHVRELRDELLEKQRAVQETIRVTQLILQMTKEVTPEVDEALRALSEHEASLDEEIDLVSRRTARQTAEPRRKKEQLETRLSHLRERRDLFHKRGVEVEEEAP